MKLIQCGSDIRVEEHGDFAYVIRELNHLGDWETLCTSFDLRTALHVAARLAAKDKLTLRDDPGWHASLMQIMSSLSMTQDEAS